MSSCVRLMDYKRNFSTKREISFSIDEGNCLLFLNFCERITNKSLLGKGSIDRRRHVYEIGSIAGVQVKAPSWLSLSHSVLYDKIVLDGSTAKGVFTYSVPYPRSPQPYQELSCCPPIECEKAWQRGTLGRPTRRSSFLGLIRKPFSG